MRQSLTAASNSMAPMTSSPAVVVAERGDRFGAAVQADVAVGNDGAAVDKTGIGSVADRIAQLVALVAGIDEVVFAVYLADGGRLEEAVALVAGAGGVVSAGEQHSRQLLCREHVRLQLHHIGVLTHGQGLHGLNTVLRIRRGATHAFTLIPAISATSDPVQLMGFDLFGSLSLVCGFT